jgi:Flp pilus assembly protein TadD
MRSSLFARRRTCSSNALLAALAQLQASRGEIDAAIVNYKRAIPLAPTNAQIVVALGAL